MSDLTQFEEVKLIYRNKKRAIDRPKVTCPEDAYEVFKAHWDMDTIELQEECKALFLDRSMRMMSIADISKGGICQTPIDLRIVFAIALKRRATSFILAHNHPSGNLKPSVPDLNMTAEFHKAGKLLNIALEDHLILTKDGFYSIASETYAINP